MTGLVVLLRHGQSHSNLEDRFTGWQDVGLTDDGRRGARDAARLLAEAGLVFDAAFSSRLTRAESTLRIVLDEMGQARRVTVRSSWRLNERHYGALQGLEKAEAVARFGEERVRAWRRDYRSRPPAAEPAQTESPGPNGRCDDPIRGPSPLTESLEDVSKRVLPYWNGEISPLVAHGGRVLVVAHGNSLRALVKHLERLPDDEVEDLEIPTALPFVYEFDDGTKPSRHYRLGED